MFTPLSNEDLVAAVESLLRMIPDTPEAEQEIRRAQIGTAASLTRFLRAELDGRDKLLGSACSRLAALLEEAAEGGAAGSALGSGELRAAAERAVLTRDPVELGELVGDLLALMRERAGGRAGRNGDDLRAAIQELLGEIATDEAELLRSASAAKSRG